MVTALAWENVRAFDQWIDSIRMLRHSHDNDPEVMLAFLGNMPTPWRLGTSSGNGIGERPCCSGTRAGSYCHDGNNDTTNVDEQLTLKILERNLEPVGSR